MKIESKHGIISRRSKGSFGYHAWGTVTKLADGTLAAACSGGRIWHVCPFGKSMLFFSRDEGATWSSPVIVNDTWLDDRDVGLTTLPSGNLLMSWFSLDFEILDAREEILKRNYSPDEWELVNAYRRVCECDPSMVAGSYLRVSKDGGLTWGEPVETPVNAPHGPTVLNDGSLLYFGKRLGMRNEAVRNVVALRSTDEGQTWEELGQPPLPANTNWDQFHEPHAIQLPSGRILGVIRYEGKAEGFEQYGVLTMFVTWSDDGGKTWITPRCLNVSGSPPHLMRHSSGAILCSYGRRVNGDFSERVLISWDDGESWQDDIAIFNNVPDWDLGYPSTVELSDGSLLTAYYQKFQDGDQVDKKASFLYTKWKLPSR